jgi:hypothetical protein
LSFEKLLSVDSAYVETIHRSDEKHPISAMVCRRSFKVNVADFFACGLAIEARDDQIQCSYNYNFYSLPVKKGKAIPITGRGGLIGL